MASGIVRVLRLASLGICLIVIASFLTFAVSQTKSGSVHQQEELGVNVKGGGQQSNEGSVRKTLDEVSNELTSPFAGVVSGSSSEWATRGVKLILALLVYGFGLGFLARMIRIRD